ncbi:MAG TPA: hypothetical protein VGQ88_01515, partial [Burkholderiales bacterium]|nr:hypothetical protein [Burkholderiales bacterium]
AFPLACQAEIYKCVIADSIVYQDSPCTEGRNQMRVAYLNNSSARSESVRLDQNSASQFLSGHEARPILPSGRTTLSIGMSDDEVLNLPAWGRPKKITRNKANRVWHEQWAYVSPVEGEKYLHFTNGKLTAIESERVEPASLQLIAVTQR